MTVASVRRRNVWGWGYEDQQPDAKEMRDAAAGMRSYVGFDPCEPELPVALEDVELPAPRIASPQSLEGICSGETHDRASHAYGKAYRDVIRAFRGRFENPPDMVAYPRTEQDVVELLEWCAQVGAAAIPYGGGTSVTGGVEPAVGDSYSGTVSIDLRELDQVLEVDETSRAARIQAGANGPAISQQLAQHGLGLRHFPGSFELSTLGGWIATRSGGHFATVYTHIDDLVESTRAVTPTGVIETRRLPGSGAGPSPDRMLIGSEGILGVITEAWMRLHERPRFKSSASVRFADLASATAAVRELSQSGLYPTNCRLLDPVLAGLYGAGPSAEGSPSPDGDQVHLLMLAFESAHHPVDDWMELGLGCCRAHGGEGEAQNEARERRADDDGTSGSVEAWRGAFLREAYVRDVLIAAGVIPETFETAVTWDRFDEFHQSVIETTTDAVRRVCGGGRVGWRFTHVYPDGPAPYYTILAPAKRGSEVQQWDEIKAAASEAIIAAGGTITHHHSVGRDHRPWYDKQRPDRFAAALGAAKRELDPDALLNPGVLIDP
ncbi:MAG: FAD-binding oxidoreductase [Solirubrobacterales bacterium]